MESLRVSISQPWMRRPRRPLGKGSEPTALSSFSSTSTIRRKNSFKEKRNHLDWNISVITTTIINGCLISIKYIWFYKTSQWKISFSFFRFFIAQTN